MHDDEMSIDQSGTMSRNLKKLPEHNSDQTRQKDRNV